MTSEPLPGSEPAYPIPTDYSPLTGMMMEIAKPGFTQRQRAAIDLLVPESGEEWLDNMIRKSRRQKIMTNMLHGLIDGLSADRLVRDDPTSGHTAERTRTKLCDAALALTDSLTTELDKEAK